MTVKHCMDLIFQKMKSNPIATHQSNQFCMSNTNPYLVTSSFTLSEPSIDENESLFSSRIDTQFIRVSSSSSVLRVNNEDNSTQLNGQILNKSVILRYLSVFCLFLVTLKTHSSSQRLGAAALGSLTTTLSPILPFTGGTDLRRGEYSLAEIIPKGIFDSWNSIYHFATNSQLLYVDDERTQSSSFRHIIPRGGAQSSNKKQHLASKKLVESKNLQIAAPAPFLSLKEIGQMSLADFTDIMEYSIGANRIGFNKESFLSKFSPRMKDAVNNIDLACAKSRGDGVLPAKTMAHSLDGGNFGNIDAIQFCAAMRVFAEWRVLRQVPEGNKGYSVGMGLGQKDVVQNLAKVEIAIFSWIEDRRARINLNKIRIQNTDHSTSNHTSLNTNGEKTGDNPDLILRSPTLHDLLQDEIDFDVHNGKLPRLKEKSAAMGLLWVRRQLQYQTEIFKNVLSGNYPDVQTAVRSAYKSVYDDYHGWAVQKIFTYSFKAAPSAKDIYRIMNPEYLNTVLQDAKKEAVSSGKMNQQVEDSLVPFEQDGLDEGIYHNRMIANTNEFEKRVISQIEECVENAIVIKQNPFEKFGNHIITEWIRFCQHIGSETEKLLKHIGNEWDKLASNTLGLFGIKVEEKIFNDDKSEMKNGKNGSEDNKKDEQRKGLTGEDLENYINERMTTNALEHMEIYLKIAEPILQDLDELFKEMNMNDPTKV